MRLREATQADIGSLSTLCITVWIDTYCTEGIQANVATYVLSEYSPERIARTLNGKRVLVSEVNGLITGVVVFDLHSGELETLYVLPKFQGTGVGRLLLEGVRTGYEGRVFLTCWEKNESAIRFYLRNGFVETGEAYFHLDGEMHRNVELSLS